MAPTPSPPSTLPPWIGQIAIGVAIAVVSWGLGSTSSQVKRLDDLVMWQQRTQTTLDMICKQLEEKKGIDERQDKELQQIRSHLRLPPP
jgi:hypothetical protein